LCFRVFHSEQELFQLEQSRSILVHDQLLLQEIRRFLNSSLHHVTVSLDDEGALCATAKLWHHVAQSHLKKCRPRCLATDDVEEITDKPKIHRQMTDNSVIDEDPKFVACASPVDSTDPLNDWIELEKDVRQFVDHSENRCLRLLKHNSLRTSTQVKQLEIQLTRSISLTELRNPLLGSTEPRLRRWASADDVDRTISHADSFFVYNSWFDYLSSWRNSESPEGWNNPTLYSFDGWSSETMDEAVQLQSSMSLCVDKFEQLIGQLGEVTRDVLLEESCLAEPNTLQTKISLLEQVSEYDTPQ
ncbi:hypothetical protein P879_00244, partial [Paragonimus westermani]